MFYDRFLELCSRKGVAPSRAAIDAGISKSLVSKWKANEAKEPSPEVVRKLADYFGVSNYEILEDMPNKKEKTPTLIKKDEREVSDDDIKFALFGDKTIDDETYEIVKNFAKFAAEQKRKKQESEH